MLIIPIGQNLPELSGNHSFPTEQNRANFKYPYSYSVVMSWNTPRMGTVRRNRKRESPPTDIDENLLISEIEDGFVLTHRGKFLATSTSIDDLLRHIHDTEPDSRDIFLIDRNDKISQLDTDGTVLSRWN